MTEAEKDEESRIWFRNFCLWILVFMLFALDFSFMAGILSGGTAGPNFPHGTRKGY